MKFSSNPNKSLQQLRHSPISKPMPTYFVALTFQRKPQPPDQDQQNGKQI